MVRFDRIQAPGRSGVATTLMSPQLIALGQQTEAHRPSHLLDQPHVRGDAGSRLQVELDHVGALPTN
jgi:hypothetical protein